MKLNTFDRLILLNILPKEGDITTIRIVHGLRQRLSFTEDEHAALEFKTDPETGNIQWKSAADREVDIEMGEKAVEIVRDTLDKLSEAGKLQEQHLPTYDKFLKD